MYEVQRRKRSSILPNALTSFFVAFVAAAWWYLPNLQIVLARLTHFVARGVKEGDPTVYTAQGWFYYIEKLDVGMGMLYFILFIASLLWILHRRMFDKQVLALLFAIAIPYLILTALSSKNDRYIVPVLPFVALITSRVLFRD
jgi:hypothetical protein